MNNFIRAAALAFFICSCTEQDNENLIISTELKEDVLFIKFINETGRKLCIPANFLYPSWTADPPENKLAGKVFWRNTDKSARDAFPLGSAGSPYEMEVWGKNDVIRVHVEYPKERFLIGIDGYFCDEFFSESTDKMRQFSYFQWHKATAAE